MHRTAHRSKLAYENVSHGTEMSHSDLLIIMATLKGLGLATESELYHTICMEHMNHVDSQGNEYDRYFLHIKKSHVSNNTTTAYYGGLSRDESNYFGINKVCRLLKEEIIYQLKQIDGVRFRYNQVYTANQLGIDFKYEILFGEALMTIDGKYLSMYGLMSALLVMYSTITSLRLLELSGEQ